MDTDSHLLRLPEVPMKKILDYCSYLDIQRLRSTCHHLQSSLDPSMTTISITTYPGELELCLNSKNHRQETLIFHFKNMENGCAAKMIVKRNNRRKRVKKFLKQVDYLDALCADLRIFLNRQRGILEKFELSQVELEVFEKLLHIFPSLPLKVHEIRLIALSASQILPILLFFDAKHLKTMMILTSNPSDNFIDAIFDTEQWKNIRICEVTDFRIMDLKRISHFENFNGMVKSVTVEDVEYLKETFLHSPNFKKCKLMYDHNSDDWITTLPPEPLISQNRHGHTLKRWYFRCLHNEEKVLTLEWNSVKCITFEVVKISEVPSNAVLREVIC
ncbi:hypothetical protein GCK72_021398 [Caenorhabditis remanei]|uniref:F-box domain-containing protein n=1 Tax=Caenorhabditis remanei TaxID=31234 RepID=A0A6A5GJG3_CAERE|nr:hypothetical protein GCK72_021398 [Caenorhabditis remanei]KAF1754833.1 hypothetical protein GCK72_021398 [Caenorhabditis remanei]